MVVALAGAIVASAHWGGLDVRRPWAGRHEEDEDFPASPRPDAGEVLRRYVWALAIAVSSGLAAGILVAGAGGRLVMRLLAVTAGDDAQGRLTEADQAVGAITVGGTIDFIVFTALFFGLATGILYVVLEPVLPGGRMRGVAFGFLLLIVAGTRLEPLRPDNPDFDIVGPDWLAILAFGALVVLHGMVVAAIAGRLSRALPVSGKGRALLGYAPLIVLVPAAPVAVLAILGGVAVVAGSRWDTLRAGSASSGFRRFARLAIIAVVAVSLPGAARGIAEIASG